MQDSFTLKILDFQIWVHLGCMPEEQKVPQEVRVSVEIEFNSRPLACQTDSLSDTICYAALSDAIQQACKGVYFKTIEKLGWDCLEALQETTRSGKSVFLKVHKMKPPIDHLLGGSVFEIRRTT